MNTGEASTTSAGTDAEAQADRGALCTAQAWGAALGLPAGAGPPEVAAELGLSELTGVALGVAAAAGNESALRVLASEDGGAERVWILSGPREGVALYLDQLGFGELVGTQSSQLRRLRNAGRLIDPDIKVDRVWGWSQARAVLWGIETGYLNADGTRNPVRAGRPKITTAPVHWRREVVVYLTLTDTARYLGITDAAVYQSRERGAGPIESVRVGDLRGWTRDYLRIYNARRDPRRRALSQEAAPQAS